jgi:hypothetical protein
MENQIGEKKVKKKFKKKVLILSIIILVLIIANITSILLYINNDEFRDWADKYILRKEITEDDAIILELRRK